MVVFGHITESHVCLSLRSPSTRALFAGIKLATDPRALRNLLPLFRHGTNTAGLKFLLELPRRHRQAFLSSPAQQISSRNLRKLPRGRQSPHRQQRRHVQNPESRQSPGKRFRRPLPGMSRQPASRLRTIRSCHRQHQLRQLSFHSLRQRREVAEGVAARTLQSMPRRCPSPIRRAGAPQDW